jgi:hypothetical protein
MKSLATLAALAGVSGCCCVSVPEEREAFRVDSSRLSEADAPRVRGLYESPSVAVELEPKTVDSTAELYDFLIDELPFTAACVRALGQGKYVIRREAEGPEPPESDPEGRRRYWTFRVDDQAGMKLEMRRLYHEELKWVYVGRVTYEGTSFGKIEGDALTIAVATMTPHGLKSEARIYTRLDSMAGLLARVATPIFAAALRRRARMFTHAASLVSEECKRDPKGFYERVRAYPDLDPDTLEKFRKRFIE